MYASTQDIKDAIGITKFNLITNSDANNIATTALNIAQGEVDAYLVRRYITPVQTQDSHAVALLRRVTVWLALYQIINNAELEDHIIQNKYLNAIKMLQNIATANLDIVGAPINSQNKKTTVIFKSKPRIFTNDTDDEKW